MTDSIKPPWPWVDVPDPSVAAAADPASPVNADVTSESALPGATGMTPDAAKTAIDAIYNDKNHPLHKGDPKAIDDMLALTRVAHADPTAPELPPVELRPQDLPTFTLPDDVSHDDPTIQVVREVTAFAELPPNIPQTAITRAVELLKQDIPESGEELDAQADRAIAAMQRKYGTEYQARVIAMRQGRAILEAADPTFRQVFAHPLVANDPTIFISLSELGLRSRTHDARRYGTSRAERF
jgi:hypothetical protein